MDSAVTVWDIGAFVVEVALVVIAVMAVRSIVGSGVPGWLAAGATVLVIGVVWGLLVAPKATYLLADTPRAALAAAIVLAVSGVAVWSGLVITGLALALIGTPLMLIAQLSR